MAISADYPSPVYVNGYACHNCTQVAEAKKGIDPADPKAGPYGVDAKTDPTAGMAGHGPAVVFGGVLTQTAGGSTGSAASSSSTRTFNLQSSSTGSGLGRQLDLSV